MSGKSFFDKYANEYDFLTNAKVREKNHRLEVRTLIERFGPTSVLDAGCGTGLTTALFASEAVNTTGIDLSRKMIVEARRKYDKKYGSLAFKQADFTKLPKTMNNRFDLIVCLANAIAGVQTVAGLNRTIGNFHRVLSPGGSLVLQMLNLESLKEGEPLPIKVTKRKGVFYMRFLKREGRSVNLNVIRLDTNRPRPDFEPFTSSYIAFAVKHLKEMLSRSRFNQVKAYGNLFMTKRFSRSGRDVVFVATKGEARS